jgi:hypothetical protein
MPPWSVGSYELCHLLGGDQAMRFLDGDDTHPQPRQAITLLGQGLHLWLPTVKPPDLGILAVGKENAD